MSDDGSDSFDLEGKNLRRVIPQVRKNIRIQRARVIEAAFAFVFCLTFGGLAIRSSWSFFRYLAVGFLVVSPFAIIGIIADWHLWKWQKARLAECERRLQQESDREN
jgi:hypothetical protein